MWLSPSLPTTTTCFLSCDRLSAFRGPFRLMRKSPPTPFMGTDPYDTFRLEGVILPTLIAGPWLEGMGLLIGDQKMMPLGAAMCCRTSDCFKKFQFEHDAVHHINGFSFTEEDRGVRISHVVHLSSNDRVAPYQAHLGALSSSKLYRNNMLMDDNVRQLFREWMIEQLTSFGADRTWSHSADSQLVENNGILLGQIPKLIQEHYGPDFKYRNYYQKIIPFLQQTLGDSISITGPAGEWFMITWTIHKLKQSIRRTEGISQAICTAHTFRIQTTHEAFQPEGA